MPSTSLRDISYDPDSRTLDVTFISSGRRYRYFAVEPEEYEALKRVYSKRQLVQSPHQAHPRLRAAVARVGEAPGLRPISATVAKLYTRPVTPGITFPKKAAKPGKCSALRRRLSVT